MISSAAHSFTAGYGWTRFYGFGCFGVERRGA